MSIVVECRTCQKRMKAPERLAGKRARCKCGAAVEIPILPSADPAPTDLSDLLGLADGETISGPRCPSCKAEMAEGAVVCMRCGYNQQTGQVVRLDLESTSSTPTPAGAPSAPTEDKPGPMKRAGGVIKADEPSAAGGIVKWVIILAVFGGLGFLGWQIKEMVTFDPKQQLKDDLTKVTAGMTMKQVVSALGGKGPREVQTWQDPPAGSGGLIGPPKIRKLVYSDDMMKRYSKEDLKYGFQFVYRYTDRDYMVITFDPTGIVISVEEDDPLAMLGI